MQEKEEKSVLSTLRDMQVNEQVSFPASRSSYVKCACTNFGFEWGKKFKTRSNRESMTVDVTRVS